MCTTQRRLSYSTLQSNKGIYVCGERVCSLRREEGGEKEGACVEGRRSRGRERGWRGSGAQGKMVYSKAAIIPR